MADTNDGFVIAERDLRAARPRRFLRHAAARPAAAARRRSDARRRLLSSAFTRRARRVDDGTRRATHDARLRRRRCGSGSSASISGRLLMRIIAGSSRAAGSRRRRGTGCGRPPTSCARRSSTSSRRASPGARVLDVFAGTGAIGLESLSRGAARGGVHRARSPRAPALIAANAELCGVRDRCAIIRDTAEHVLQNADRRRSIRFGHARSAVRLRAAGRVVDAARAASRAGGLLILEHAHAARRCRPSTVCSAVRTVRSGDSALTLFEARHEPTLTARSASPHVAVFPGSFDPLTNGHVDIIERGCAHLRPHHRRGADQRRTRRRSSPSTSASR